MSENKVQFNLKNVHYAVYTPGTDTFATPVAVPGAVSLSLEQNGEVTPFYADGILYYNSIGNNGYTGDVEMARIPDTMLVDIWGMTLGATSKVITEKANVEPKEFALLFQIDGDQNGALYVLYRCAATRPNIASQTNTATKEPVTQTFNVTCMPMKDNKVQAHTTDATPTATVSGWFSSVFVEGASPAPDPEDPEDPEGT